ncbi:hypothetical protein LJ754_10425 [Arthrobacter sp. zg-Y40]|uniref:hypothetical protein n=1 Tax=Arthrobacter sp. zg-Y40 TaxID=2886939 RepID=UPI001D145E97|nr:hypothetical protein [Arthrobacter sp. zg-Y40]MCC3279564.1 hypothetical protein [Arthrobacter sp. zg-Y40]
MSITGQAAAAGQDTGEGGLLQLSNATAVSRRPPTLIESLRFGPYVLVGDYAADGLEVEVAASGAHLDHTDAVLRGTAAAPASRPQA